jgi:TetR/AcrR family transcriptional regulator, transcriptional repressor for nem operon
MTVPWPKQHKLETRARILDAAAAAFRAEGVAGVGVADVMERAGLTHGGFYAHFDSKDELLTEALRHAMSRTGAQLEGGESPTEKLRSRIDRYLTPGHRDHPELGCPIAALGAEISRAGGTARKGLAAGIRARIEQLSDLMPASQTAEIRERNAAAVFACMVGGILLARGLDDREAGRLLEACREFLHAALDDAGTRADGDERPATPPRRRAPAPRAATGAAKRRGSAAAAPTRASLERERPPRRSKQR